MRKRAKLARPGIYTDQRAKQILDRLANGESLRAICRGPGMPAEATVRAWVIDRPQSFGAQYARARDLGLDSKAEETLEIADTVLPAIRRKTVEAGSIWACPKCSRECEWQGKGWRHADDKSKLCRGVAKPESKVLYKTETVRGDAVERAKLMVQSRQWFLSKLAPKKYGTAYAEIRNIHEIDWSTAPPELIELVAEQLLSRLFPANPAGAAEARKKIEAGQLDNLREEVV